MKITPANLEPRISDLLGKGVPANWQPSGLDRNAYLDLMEPILQQAATWQDAQGAIIDPVEKKEHGQTSCRFVAPGAILLSAGRGENLRERVLRGMDWCCQRLVSGEAQSPDFWMRELMTAWSILKEMDPQRAQGWRKNICAVDPEAIYWQVSRDGAKLAELHNWTVYAAAGEALREMAGLGPQPDPGTVVWGKRFFEKYMPFQMRHFSEFGMYRDPNDPFTYDMTTRLQFAIALAGGFVSPLSGQLDDILRRGALVQLLYVSPGGYAPFGGRSGQMHLQEAILAALCELEARRYRPGNLRLAQAFKRQAHRHVVAIGRWITGMSPIRQVKNGFDPATRHGCEDYAKWSVYSLFAASCLGLAWQFADEQIEEMPCPAEIGGYVLELQPAFHKVFAACGQTQVEIDTAADPHYDATGLGRFTRSQVPLELGLSMPLPAHPRYQVAAELLPATSLAIGPGWHTDNTGWQDLASLSENLGNSVEIIAQDQDQVCFRMQWQHALSGIVVEQEYQLSAGQLQMDTRIEGKGINAVRFTVPLLETDGTSSSQITSESGQVQVTYLGHQFLVRFAGDVQREFGEVVANRNGIYRPLILTSKKQTHMRIVLTLQ